MTPKPMHAFTVTLPLILLALAGEAHSASLRTDSPRPPLITKKGTLGLDLCETTPFVFRDRLYRLEWFRNGSILRINYCWGTQGGPGHEYIAEAEFAGSEPAFLTGWFPLTNTPTLIDDRSARPQR